MEYEVLATLVVENNTSIIVKGDGGNLKNGMLLTTPDGERFKLLSVGMFAGGTVSDTIKVTPLLVEGRFTAKTFRV